MMDLWLRLEQARNDDSFLIAKVEKMIANNEDCDDLPEPFRPKEFLKILKYDKLEELMHQYQCHFKREINTMGIELELRGWEILLEYCITNSRPLEIISNRDIYRIKNPKNMCLEEGMYYNVPVSYQKSKLYRKITSLIKRRK